MEPSTYCSKIYSAEIEVDESYFGGVRKGKRGRGAAGKVPVFGLLKRGGRVYTKIIPDARSEPLLPIIEEKGPYQGNPETMHNIRPGGAMRKRDPTPSLLRVSAGETLSNRWASRPLNK